MLNRRQFLSAPPVLGAGALLSGGLALPRVARAAGAADRKFIVVFAQGGWDPTRVLADGFDRANVAMEPGSQRGQVGELRFVDHPDRPSVRAFFERHAGRAVIAEGVRVRSVIHEMCTRITMTGDTSGTAPDWPAVIGNAAREAFALPHVVLGGPSFPGSLDVAVGRTGAGDTLASQAAVAVEALSLGVARCLTLAADAGATGWDTHVDNDNGQSHLWESLFAGLAQLLSSLENTPGRAAATLAEETTVVVASEMGRTPALNALLGKDHWPYTSVLMVGSGLSGGRNIGGWDSNWYGRPLDPASAELSESGAELSAESIGATLLALADIDPAEHIRGATPVTGILA